MNRVHLSLDDALSERIAAEVKRSDRKHTRVILDAIEEHLAMCDQRRHTRDLLLAELGEVGYWRVLCAGTRVFVPFVPDEDDDPADFAALRRELAHAAIDRADASADYTPPPPEAWDHTIGLNG
ncbi:MAG: hypothetical protein ABIP03_04945 [Aquihabitans sp.]